jgi:hypothetical protein
MTVPETTLLLLQLALLGTRVLVAIGHRVVMQAWHTPMISLGTNIAVGGTIVLVLSPHGAARLGIGGQIALLAGYGAPLLAAFGLTWRQCRRRPPVHHARK